jgi:hypothetical protein
MVAGAFGQDKRCSLSVESDQMAQERRWRACDLKAGVLASTMAECDAVLR